MYGEKSSLTKHKNIARIRRQNELLTELKIYVAGLTGH